MLQIMYVNIIQVKLYEFQSIIHISIAILKSHHHIHVHLLITICKNKNVKISIIHKIELIIGVLYMSIQRVFLSKTIDIIARINMATS